MEEDTPNNSNRRTALKALAAATGAAGLAALPTRWSKPAVMVGAVPAHAQTSCVEWALIVEHTGGDGALRPTAWTEPPEFIAGASYWACGGGCLSVHVRNDEGGTASGVVTVFGIQVPVGPFGPAEGVWFVLNRNTFAWDTADILDNINWNGIGCTQPD